MKNEIAIKNYDLAKADDLTKMASILRTHIAKHKLFTEISGKAYVHADGWGFAGGMLGLLPRVVSVEKLQGGTIERTDENGKINSKEEIKYMCKVEIIDKNDRIVGIGIAICSNRETKKRSFDEYAVLSMAQTRAIGKAYRNLIGWVMKIAGYETVPSEEMSKDQPEVNNDNFEKAVNLVQASRDIGSLIEYETKLKSGKRFNTEQKERLTSIIRARVSQLENEQEKTA